MNLVAAFDRGTARHPDRPFLDHQEGSVTYAEAKETSQRIAGGFRDLVGLEPADTLAVYAPNHPAGGLTYLAAWRLGVTVALINSRLDAGEIPYLVDDSEADALVFHDATRERVEAVRDELAVDRFVGIGTATPEWAHDFGALRRHGPLGDDIEITGDTRASLAYTSGTTGDPKGIPIDHQTRINRVLPWLIRDGVMEADDVLLVLPLDHSMGLTVFTASLVAGATLVFPPSVAPDDLLQTIQERSIDVFQAVPAILQPMVDEGLAEAYDTSCLRRIEFGGGLMPEGVYRSCRDQLVDDCRNFYGTTETMNIAYSREPSNAVGQAVQFQEVRLVEPESKDSDAVVEAGELGEVIVRMDAPEVFEGYWRKPAQTEAVVHDGWFFTEDIAYRNDDGRLNLEGRLDNMIVSGGENIAPVEVEDVLLEHPNVADAGVTGVADDRWGERVVALVQITDPTDEDSLADHCRRRLAEFKVPKDFMVVDELPRTQTGIDRKRLAELGADARDR